MGEQTRPGWCCNVLLLLLQSTQRVLATFTAWDLDGNGTLSKSEFSAISQVRLHLLLLCVVGWQQQQQQLLSGLLCKL